MNEIKTSLEVLYYITENPSWSFQILSTARWKRANLTDYHIQCIIEDRLERGNQRKTLFIKLVRAKDRIQNKE